MTAQPNPYHPWTETLAANALALGPDGLLARRGADRFAHIRPDSEWIYADAACRLDVIAYEYARPGSRFHRAPEAMACIDGLFRRLLAAARDDRWYHNEPGKGDPNIDRFTLLPFMDAFDRVKEELPEPLRRDCLGKIQGVLDVQFREFGQEKKDTPKPLYPNMDAYYCLIMLQGHRLTGREDCRTQFSRYLEQLEAAQFEAGAWTYYKGTNECPIYHDLVVVLLGRVWDLCRDERALRMLQRSVPYYPRVISPHGVPEYYTDPWWKHTWSPQPSFGPDVVASLTGDGANRWVGNRVREAYAHTLVHPADDGPNNILNLFVDAAALWKDVEETPPPCDLILHDENIQGPRGLFPDWSWAATARYGSDTVVGAMAHAPDRPVAALLGVVAEVEHPQGETANDGLGRLGLGITPPGTCGETTLNADSARFEVAYPLACYRSVWGAEPFPFAWECRQAWDLGRTALVGTVVLTSTKDQASPPPLIRVRFGRDQPCREDGAGRYVCGPYLVEVIKSDYPSVSVEPAAVCYYMKARDATDIVFRPAAAAPGYTRGQAFRLSLRIGLAPGG